MTIEDSELRDHKRVREQTAAYVAAVLAAHPELATTAACRHPFRLPLKLAPPKIFATRVPVTAIGLCGVLDLVERETGVAPGEVLGRSRNQRVVAARFRAATIMRDEGLSYAEIGRQLKRDHSTIIYAVRRSRERHAP